jgi:hypothetical protein
MSTGTLWSGNHRRTGVKGGGVRGVGGCRPNVPLDYSEWKVGDWSDVPVDRLGRPRKEGQEEKRDNSLLQYLRGNR